MTSKPDVQEDMVKAANAVFNQPNHPDALKGREKKFDRKIHNEIEKIRAEKEGARSQKLIANYIFPV